MRALDLASTFGTPLYVLSEKHFRERIRRYQSAVERFCPKFSLSYASKANGTLAVLQIAANEGMGIDTAGAGELIAALQAGVPPSRCHLHGNAKSRIDLEMALSNRIGKLVLDHAGELEFLSGRDLQETELILRINPNILADTHQKIATAHADSKFGFSIQTGAAEEAVARCVALNLPLTGFHIHLGSMIRNPSTFQNGAKEIVEFAIQMADRYKFEFKELNLGGGIAVRQTLDSEPVDVEGLLGSFLPGTVKRLNEAGYDPVIGKEPGRSIIAEAGITLYEIITRKWTGRNHMIAVDGGLSDNPSPALYDRKFDVLNMRQGQGTERFQVVGAHCESDILFEDVALPADTRAGDILQVQCTGAYNSSMASNYNKFRRPATVLIRTDGSAVLVQRRETWEELLAREIMLEDPTPPLSTPN